MKDLEGKCAFVTGGASGIGLAIARALGRAGVKLVLADVDEGGLERAAQGLRDDGFAVQTLTLDVTDRAAWETAARAAESVSGVVDILVNNAGVGSSRQLVEETADDDWSWVLAVNLGGLRHGLKTFLPRMKARPSPAHIVNTASLLAHFAVPGIADYVTSKFAVAGLTEALRMELQGTHVGISLLCPGLVATPLSDNARGIPPSSRAGADAVAAGPPALGIAAEHVGQCVVDGILGDHFYLFTHPEYAAIVDLRTAEVRAALAGARATTPADDLGYLGKGVLGLAGK